MAKKKKKKPQAPSAPVEESFSNEAFSALKSLKKASKKPVKTPPPAPRVRSAPVLTPPESPETEEALFAQAMEAFNPSEIYTKKYGQEDDLRRRRSTEAALTKASKDPREAEQILFEREMMASGVKALESRYVTHSPDPKELAERIANQRWLESNPPPPKPEALSKNQKKLVDHIKKQSKQGDAPLTLTLRGLTRSIAIERLIAFLNRAREEHAGTVRVVTGKGKQSEESTPVLKPLVARVLEDHPAVAEIAPELTQDGDFGAYLVRLKRR